MDREPQMPEPSWNALKKTLLNTLRELLPDAPDAGKVEFREEQEQVIKQIMNGRDVLAVMPTGGGKSVCYQVPAMHLPGITLVISPLLALMEDQVNRLYQKGFPVACLSSSFIVDRHGFHRFRRAGEDDGGDGKPEPKSFRALRNRIFLDAERGEYKLLYVTPERLRNGQFIRFAQTVKISMLAVDEAHCISLWGYDFRPRYLEITRLLTRIGYHPIIAAFTATAAKSVKRDIVKLLGMDHPWQRPYREEARNNLRFSVRHISADRGMKKRELLRYLRQHRGSSGFVYCGTVDAVRDVCQYLRGKGVAATRYYAGLDKAPDKKKGESKEHNFDEFLRGKKTVMVSTTALGMGIDKSDIRFVIHYNLPACLENYYQEAGRAGRDGLPAECILYYGKEDIAVCAGLIESAVKNSELSARDKKLHRNIADQRLKRMVEYAERGKGRDSDTLRQWILDYFRTFDPHGGASKADEPEVLSRLKQIDVLYVNRTKVANKLRAGYMAGTELVVGKAYRESSGGAPAPTVSYHVDGGPLSYFDLMVADAVYTLMKHRAPTIYAKAVMELLSGNENLLLRPERKEQVENSIRKMIRADIVIDRNGSAGYGFVYRDQRDKPEISGKFLPLYEKKRGFGYEDGALPPLYEYAEILNGQFFSFPTKYLRVESLPATDRNLAMTHYLLCRANMASALFDPKLHSVASRNVRFDTVINTLGIELPEGTWYRERKMKSLWEEKMIPILKHLQTLGVIRQFELAPGGESVALYRFIPREKKK